MKKIVITNEKGGTGKSTFTALLVEYLNYKEKKVQLVDTDPLQTSKIGANNCQSEGRIVSNSPADYQIIDTAGSSGSAHAGIRSADLIVVPLQMHYADLKVTRDGFLSLNQELQRKILFLPNRWQNTREQREGAKHLQFLVHSEKVGHILSPLNNRPALYGELLNGSKENFFINRSGIEEALKVVQSCLAHERKLNSKK